MVLNWSLSNGTTAASLKIKISNTLYQRGVLIERRKLRFIRLAADLNYKQKVMVSIPMFYFHGSCSVFLVPVWFIFGLIF